MIQIRQEFERSVLQGVSQPLQLVTPQRSRGRELAQVELDQVRPGEARVAAAWPVGRWWRRVRQLFQGFNRLGKEDDCTRPTGLPSAGLPLRLPLLPTATFLLVAALLGHGSALENTGFDLFCRHGRLFSWYRLHRFPGSGLAMICQGSSATDRHAGATKKRAAFFGSDTILVSNRFSCPGGLP